MKDKRVIQPSKRHMRVKVWWQGADTVLNLVHNKPVILRESWFHDEGWSSADEHIVRRFNSVTLDRYTDGTDCDGRMSSETNLYWHRSMGVSKLGYPKWERVSSRQRDHSAEAMGY